MPLFGSKKNKEQGADIEAPEDDGLFMAQGSEVTASVAPPAPVDGEDSEAEPAGLTEDDVTDLSAAESEAEVTPESEEAVESPAAAEAEEESGSGADDLMSAFQDDETHDDLTDITKDLEDVPIADLLAELREIRATLPPDALGTAEDAA